MTTELYLPKPEDPPDPDFRETLEGGHALILEYAPGHAVVLEYGDCEFWARCQCGYRVMNPTRPDQSQAPTVGRVLTHTAFSGYPLEPHCQCGVALGGPFGRNRLEAQLAVVMGHWEKHCMALPLP